MFGPSGFWTMAPLRYAAKFDPFLSWRNPRKGRDQILPSGNPDNSEEEENTLALSLANRSACLFHMGEYEAAASDVHSAIASGYPEGQGRDSTETILG